MILEYLDSIYDWFNKQVVQPYSGKRLARIWIMQTIMAAANVMKGAIGQSLNAPLQQWFLGPLKLLNRFACDSTTGYLGHIHSTEELET